MSRGAARRSSLGGRLLSPQAADSDPLLATDNNDPRAGSTLAQGGAAGSISTTNANPRELNDVMSQLRSIGAVDPAVQAKLMDDLQKTDPSLWPLLMQTYRSSLAYQNRLPGTVNGANTATAGGISPAGVPPEITDARQVAAPNTSAQAAPTGQEKSPWGALVVPAVTKNDQVVLVAAAPAAATPPSAAAPSAISPAASPVATPTPPATTVAAAPLPAAQSAPAPAAAKPAAAPAEPPPLPAVTATPIAQAAPAAGAEQPAVQLAANNEPVPPGVIAPELAAAIASLEKQTQTPVRDAADVSRQVSLRMLYLSTGRRDEALKPINGLAPAEQEYWEKQLVSLATYLDAASEPDAATRASAASQRLNEAANRLAQLSPLVVRNIAFCTEVASYGVVTPFKETEFTPGQQVLLYAEVDNFKSEKTDKGFRTALKSNYQVVDKQGAKMAGTEPQLMEEICQNPRRDYFIRYRLFLPKPLPDGAYSLQLMVEDTLGQKVGKASLDFTIKDKK